MKKLTRNVRGGRSAAHRDATRCCRGLYRFIRSRLGDEISDREIARRWGMEWKSFAALKHGTRQVPRLRELELLANLLGVDATVVFQVAVGGEPEAARAPDPLQPIFDALPAACIVIDEQRTIVSANAALERVCAWSAADAVGKNADEVFGANGPGCPIARAFQSGQTEHQVTSRTLKGGRRVYVHRVVGPVRDDGRIARVIELAFDVSDAVRQGDLRVLSLWRDEAEEEPASGNADRRRSPRLDAGFSAQMRHGRSTQVVRVENLGAGGLFIRTDAKIPTGAEIEVEWLLPHDQQPMRARAVVAWSREAHKGREAGLGLRLLQLVPGAGARMMSV